MMSEKMQYLSDIYFCLFHICLLNSVFHYSQHSQDDVLLHLKFVRQRRWWRRRLKNDVGWDDAVPLDRYFCFLHISMFISVFHYSHRSQDVEFLFFLNFIRHHRWWRRRYKNDAVWKDAVSFRYIFLFTS